MRNTASPVVRIRDVRSDDVQDIVRIYIQSWNAGFGELMPTRQVTSDVVTQWTADLAKPVPHRWWVAEAHGCVVGFAGICPSRDHPLDSLVGEIDTIAVDPLWWRSGIGRTLMINAVEHLILDGYREAILWTLANYERGQRFYEATGWNTDGRQRGHGGQIRYHRELPSRVAEL